MVVKHEAPCAKPPSKRQSRFHHEPQRNWYLSLETDGDGAILQSRHLAWTDGSRKARFRGPFPWAHAPSPPPRLIGRGSWGLLGWQILVSRQRQPVTWRDPHWRLVPRSLGFVANSSRDAGWPIPMAPSHATPPRAMGDVVGRGRPMWRWVGEEDRDSAIPLLVPGRIVGPYSIHMAGYRASVKWDFFAKSEVV